MKTVWIVRFDCWEDCYENELGDYAFIERDAAQNYAVAKLHELNKREAGAFKIEPSVWEEGIVIQLSPSGYFEAEVIPLEVLGG